MSRRGDLFEIRLQVTPPQAGEAWVRTNLGRGAVRRREIIEHCEQQRPILARDWHDIPMVPVGPGQYRLRCPLLEAGCFEAKAFFVPAGERPVWPPGENIRLKVMAAHTVCANTVYTAFPRQFGRFAGGGRPDEGEARAVALLDGRGYAVIPPSGTFRDLARRLDTILGEMGFRILQLLPIHPVPTTFARLGRFGSPFAACDFYGVDPGMAEFDRRATPMAQFEELLDAVHQRGAFLFLDIPANHTGWASWLQLHHPEWFCRNPDGTYVNPGAWGVVWEDLCKLDFRRWDLCRYMADVFLHWCRKGVDGFRCDAGYMVPAAAWQYITARVRDEFPDTIFLLEGLGGPREAVEELLAGAGLDWAYSELFQAFRAEEVAACVEDTARMSRERGTLIHFAETHDNNRLAARSAAFARFRTALCALLSHDGAFGITNGVEWFAAEKVDVHGASPMNWGAPENQVPELRRLLALLRDHPAFHAGASLERVEGTPPGTLAYLRRPVRGGPVLVLANLSEDSAAEAALPSELRGHGSGPLTDLVTGRRVSPGTRSGRLALRLPPLTVLCLGAEGAAAPPEAVAGAVPGPAPEAVLRQEFRVLALELLALRPFAGELSDAALDSMAAALRGDPDGFLAGAPGVSGLSGPVPLIRWRLGRDERRVTLLPPGHALVVEAEAPFHVELYRAGRCLLRRRALPWPEGRHAAILVPPTERGQPVPLDLRLGVFEETVRRVAAAVLLLPDGPPPGVRLSAAGDRIAEPGLCALCSDALGAMALVRGRWGELYSQYDALLAANLDPARPVDRRVLLTRCRAWVVHRDYSQDVGPACQVRFAADLRNRVQWDFHVPVGMGRQIPLRIVLEMASWGNAVRLRFQRPAPGALADELPGDTPVEVIVRPDIEDRVCHETTRAIAGPEKRFPEAARALPRGFRFSPYGPHALVCEASSGLFTPEPEWHYRVPYPVEAGRGLSEAGDVFSPGYFRFELTGGGEVTITATCGEPHGPWPAGTEPMPESLPLEDTARRALGRFLVRRDGGRTVVAGYPWFLDWGRDTLICLRGIIAAGMLEEAADILVQFASFEQDGTLPNMLLGADAGNRDTSDAPLWLFVAAADHLAAAPRAGLLGRDCGGRTLARVLADLAGALLRGAANGTRVDPETGLVFSPAHFTWMDTNHPAGTPRQGYPIEIQALWHAALTLLAAIRAPGPSWSDLAARVRREVLRLYPLLPGRGLSDCLHAEPGVGARAAQPDDACRPNQLLAVTLGLVEGPPAREAVAACWPLVVPGGVRSLADEPVACPLEIRHRGRLLNDPRRPYWGHYEGDEDTRRKPAYHNGTAWTWLLPSFAEALVRAHGPAARPAARSLLASAVAAMETGCLGHVPEILDGDAPHTPRGCVAQAWGTSELLRVLRWLDDATPAAPRVSN